MKYRRLDENGDMTFGQGASNFLTGVDAVAQAIMTRLKLYLNEWWENLDDGLPLWQQILAAPATQENIDAIDLIIRNRILGTLDVKAVEDFESIYSAQTRKYQFVSTVDTNYGELTTESDNAL